MCGIFGAVTTSESFDQASYERFRKLTDLVQYRGPDDTGCIALCSQTGQIIEPEHSGFDVFLGHRRLSILDLSASGHQPMQYEGCWITYNGEIFNFLELRQELAQRGHQFTTETDTEVILHVYAEYGEDGFEKLNGMWAFALIDVRRRRLILSRDRFSIKPLYFVRHPEVFFFASEIKQLLPLLPHKEMDSGLMSNFLVQGLADHTRETFFKGISRVPAKTNIVVDLRKFSVEEKVYWKYGNVTPVYNNADAVARFRDLLEDSVRIRLRSDVKVGVLLSGGLDSSSIALAAHQLTSGKIEMYSVVSDDPRYSEERFVTCLSKTRGVTTRQITFRPGDVCDVLHAALQMSDEPFGTLSVLAQYKLFESIKQASDVTVLLSGQGGDEILLGYLKFFVLYLQNLLRRGAYSKALLQVFGSVIHRTAVFQLGIRNARRYVRSLNEFRRLIKPDYQFVPIRNAENLRERQMSDLDEYSIPVLARYEDRNSMAYSLEVRHPFLDHRLVDFCLNLPPERKIGNGWTKHILRQAFPELPPCIRWRRDKQGFTTPEEHWLRNEFTYLLKSNFHKSRLAEMGILDQAKFLGYYDHFRNGGRVPFSDISRALIAEVWCRQHF